MEIKLKSDSIINLPSKKGSYPLVIIFGGMYYANPEWMKQQVTDAFLEKSILLIIPYTKTYAEVLPDALEKIDENGYKVKGKALMGFSAGGYDVLQNYSDDFYFIGLIDPSVNSSGLDLPLDRKFNMMFNEQNWGSYPNIKSLQPQYSKKITSNGGTAIRTNLKHSDIPKEFFKEFEGKILSRVPSKLLGLLIPITLLIAGVGSLIYYYKNYIKK
jgi:hypothetical protein